MTKEFFWTRLDKSMAAEYAAWKLLNEEEEISDEEFWKRLTNTGRTSTKKLEGAARKRNWIGCR